MLPDTKPLGHLRRVLPIAPPRLRAVGPFTGLCFSPNLTGASALAGAVASATFTPAAHSPSFAFAPPKHGWPRTANT